MIQVMVDNQDGEPPPLPSDHIESLIKVTMAGEGQSEGQVQVIFVSDESLGAMKRRFFNEDVYTDVIAFNLNEPEESVEGEIYISSERARENAPRFGATWEEELCRLVVHGALHLLGYEDRTENEQAAMRHLEDRYLEEVGPEGTQGE